MDFSSLLPEINFAPLIRTIITLLIIYLVLNLLLKIGKKALLKRAKTKKHISNVEIFTRVLWYGLILFLIIFAILSYTGSWTGLGVGLGLLSAALGFALQKPITGVAAWIMIVVRRPFEIGDRIIIGTMKGDVTDITLTHIYMKEVGGLIDVEDQSGRIIMVPNSILFEQNIINYTLEDDYILGQVVTSVTYESNLDKALRIILDAAKKQLEPFKEQTKKEPVLRISFEASSIDVKVRYIAPTKRIQGIASQITKEIYDQFKKHKDVAFAYPHTEVILRKK